LCSFQLPFSGQLANQKWAKRTVKPANIESEHRSEMEMEK